MGPLLFRLAILTLGMGLVEIGLVDAVDKGTLFGWLSTLGGGLLVVLGTRGVIGPLLATAARKGDSDHE